MYLKEALSLSHFLLSPQPSPILELIPTASLAILLLICPQARLDAHYILFATLLRSLRKIHTRLHSLSPR